MVITKKKKKKKKNTRMIWSAILFTHYWLKEYHAQKLMICTHRTYLILHQDDKGGKKEI